MKSCNECKFLMSQDSGYSNWTVEETTYHCLRDLNSNLPAEDSNWSSDRPERDKAFSVAESCGSFCLGYGIALDVDCSGEPEGYTDDEDVRAAYRSYMGDGK